MGAVLPTMAAAAPKWRPDNKQVERKTKRVAKFKKKAAVHRQPKQIVVKGRTENFQRSDDQGMPELKPQFTAPLGGDKQMIEFEVGRRNGVGRKETKVLGLGSKLGCLVSVLVAATFASVSEF